MTQTKLFLTFSTCIKSEVEKPDEFLDSEPSPTNFSQPVFQPITPTTPVENSISTSLLTDVNPILSPLWSNAPDVPSPIKDDQLELDLDNFIIHQQQIHNTTNSLTIHQLTHSASTSEPSIPSVHVAPTRAQKILWNKSLQMQHHNSLLTVHHQLDSSTITHITLTHPHFQLKTFPSSLNIHTTTEKTKPNNPNM